MTPNYVYLAEGVIKMHWIVKLESGVWLAEGDGDPPRTLLENNARTFSTHGAAEAALYWAQTRRPFDRAEIMERTAE